MITTKKKKKKNNENDGKDNKTMTDEVIQNIPTQVEKDKIDLHVFPKKSKKN